MSTFEAFRGDVVFEAHTGRAETGIEKLRAEAHAAYGAMSTDALRAAVAQEKLDKTIARHGATSTQAKQATISYRREMDSLTHAANRDAVAIDRAEREVGQFTRGAIAGSGAMRSFGRSAAYLSSGFLGGAGVVYAIRSTIKAGIDAEQVVKQTANAVERAGLSWEQYRDQINQAAFEQSTLSGFDDERLLGTFQKFVRSTGDVTEALRLNAIAANVARGADIELEQATKIVLRAQAGQARGLAVLGVEVKKGATGVQLLAELEEKFARAAEVHGNTAAGAQARFAVAVENTQQVIAEDYLPAITDAFNEGADWLNQTENQERIQRAVNQVVDDGAEVVHALADAMEFARDVGEPLVEVLGGLENTVKLLIAAMAVSKVRAFAGALGLIGPAGAKAGAGLAAAGAGGAVAGAGAGGLARFALTRGGGLAISGGLLAGWLADQKLEQHQGWLDRNHLGWINASGTDLFGALFGGDGGEKPKQLTIAEVSAAIGGGWLKPAGVEKLRDRFETPQQYRVALLWAQQIAAKAPTDKDERWSGTPPDTTAAAAGPEALSSAALRQIGLAADPNNMQLLQEQAQADRAALEFLKKRRANGKIANAEYIDQVVAITTDLQSTEAQIKSIEDAADKARDDDAKKRADAERDRAAKVKANNDRLLELHRDMWAADRKANKKAAEERRKAEAERIATARENLVSRLQNAVALAQLHTTEAGESKKLLEKARREEIAADLALLKEYRRQQRDPKLTVAQHLGARAAEIAVRETIARLKQAGHVGDTSTPDGSWREAMQGFLSSFADIQGRFAPNAFPVAALGGKSETHLFEAVHELRQQTHELRQVNARGKFPASNYHQVAMQMAAG